MTYGGLLTHGEYDDAVDAVRAVLDLVPPELSRDVEVGHHALACDTPGR